MSDPGRWAQVHELLTLLEDTYLPPLVTLDVYGVQGEQPLSVAVWLRDAHDADRVLEALPFTSYERETPDADVPLWMTLTNRRALRGTLAGNVSVTVYAPVPA